ncbi:MAG TPA: orotidine-5'-phosphate decarboxylase [Chloroflexota bacterium]|jgi:orotidine-5'-phosphate decarboxylase|nr:orotidine-5'-phosphate decarboxylase [Chloroflexota bacterium]
MIQVDFHAQSALFLANSTFYQRLRAAARAHDSLLCVGLDPDPALLPAEFAGRDVADWLPAFVHGIVDATHDLVCCYKPNIAFFEAFGLPGQVALRSVLKAMPSDVPVLIDAKRGDIGSTSTAYARALFDELGADAVTVSPYLGGDALEPFFAYADRGVFVLCKTSNPGSGELQDMPLADGEPLYLHVARRAQTWDQHGTLGLVVGATYPSEVAEVRRVAPGVPFLLPGVGSQAGDLEGAVRAAVDDNAEGALVNASRSVAYASKGADWQVAARAEAERLKKAINAARRQPATAER